ncbi:MAG: hypothetical protein AB1546_02945, partial [bacterium]
KFPQGGWNLNAPLEMQPESEWGTLPNFADSVRNFAHLKGLDVFEIALNHPEQYSALAYRLHNLTYAKEGFRPNNIFLDCFTFLDPFANLKLGILPLWLAFNCADSLRFAKNFLASQGRTYENIYLALVPSFCAPPDTPPVKDWIEALSPYGRVRLIGVSSSRYPEDLFSFYKFTIDISKRIAREKTPRILPPEASELEIVYQNLVEKNTEL